MKEIDYIKAYLSGMKRRHVSFSTVGNVISAKQPIGKGSITAYFIFNGEGECSDLYIDLDQYAQKMEGGDLDGVHAAIQKDLSWYHTDTYKNKPALHASCVASERVKDLIHDSYAALCYMMIPKFLGRRMGTNEFEDTENKVRDFTVEGIRAKGKMMRTPAFALILIGLIVWPLLILGIVLFVKSRQYNKEADALNRGEFTFAGPGSAPEKPQPKPIQQNPKPIQRNPKPKPDDTPYSDDGDFEWKLSEDGNSYSIVKYIGGDSIVSIPRTHNGKQVLTIDKNAFEKAMVSVVRFPKGLFGCDNMAFAGCTMLKSVILNDDIRGLGAGVFANCISLKEITLPASLGLVSKICFYGCKDLVVHVKGSTEKWNKEWDVINPNTGERVKKA